MKQSLFAVWCETFTMSQLLLCKQRLSDQNQQWNNKKSATLQQGEEKMHSFVNEMASNVDTKLPWRNISPVSQGTIVAWWDSFKQRCKTRNNVCFCGCAVCMKLWPWATRKHSFRREWVQSQLLNWSWRLSSAVLTPLTCTSSDEANDSETIQKRQTILSQRKSPAKLSCFLICVSLWWAHGFSQNICDKKLTSHAKERNATVKWFRPSPQILVNSGKWIVAVSADTNRDSNVDMEKQQVNQTIATADLPQTPTAATIAWMMSKWKHNKTTTKCFFCWLLTNKLGDLIWSRHSSFWLCHCKAKKLTLET